ncbi:MAG: DNA (cytosine-5-)-methyltransferase [Bacteroidales bacterium]|nr:DNA (cytosine-5-)-methyltransferase [Bacteroidales bacterium]
MKSAKPLSRKKAIKYSEIRERFKIQVDKATDDQLASFTHYIHNQRNGSAQCYLQGAIDYCRDFNLAEDVDLFSEYNPMIWDIPFPVPEPPLFKFIDLFAGIGGIRLAYQNLGGKSVFTSEIDNYAKKTYEANFGEVPFGDITKIDENLIPDHDILLAGFPCQPFSIAGVSKKASLGREHGFKDKTQGTLFFDIARILEAKQPKAFMLENVKNLVSHDKGNTFKIIAGTLTDLGYKIFFKVLDGKYYVPQHRERIIIVGFREEIYGNDVPFTFPSKSEGDQIFRTILEDEPEEKYTLSDKLWNYLQDYAVKHKAKGNGFGFGMTDLNGVARTLSARYYKDGSEVLVPQPGNNPRRMTPRECARLMGFPDNFIIPVSDNRAYKQFGNSVIVPMIQAVAEQVTKVMLNEQNRK